MPPPQKPPAASCTGSPSFDPDARARDTATHEAALAQLARDDFAGAIRTWFGLPARDDYVYHATASLRLNQAQHAVGLGPANGLHAWYRDPSASSGPSSSPMPPPPRADVEAYIALFPAASSTASAMRALGANAKKGSVRASVARHLAATRRLHPALPAPLQNVPRNRSPPPNPYLDFWAWSCRALEWAGPCDESASAAAAAASGRSHHVLPVLMHHFGCAVPSYEALVLLRGLAAGRAIADVGSGGGYWTFALRAHGPRGAGAVVPVDCLDSAWRVTWVSDTVVADGAAFLAARDGGRDMVLLLVYPVVGKGGTGSTDGTDGDGDGAFTRRLLAAYRGDTLAVVGTQNANGYTGFRHQTMDQFMARDEQARLAGWVKTVQLPLPSFAGKDDALFVFQRGERAPREGGTGVDG